MDLMMEDDLTVKKTNSFYFIGFALGALFFPFPDLLGLKATMNIVLPINVFGAYLVNFGNTLALKSIGYFVLGFGHIKITTSINHML